MKNEVIFEVIVLFLAVFAVFARACFIPADRAVQAVRQQGFTHAYVVERHELLSAFYGCYYYRDTTGFVVSAENAHGRRLNRTVCCGLLFNDRCHVVHE